MLTISIFAFAVSMIYVLYKQFDGIYIAGLLYKPIDKIKIEELFQQDKEYIFEVKDYLTKLESDKIYISSNMENGKLSNAGDIVELNYSEIEIAIDTLKKRGYSVIGKEYGIIYFQRQSTLDSGYGIAYLIDDNESTLQFLTKLEPLNCDGWYYYEEDYNEWKANNVTNNIPNYIIGSWTIKYAKTRSTEIMDKDYPLQDLYGKDISYNKSLSFNADGTFSRYVGTILDGEEHHEGTYLLRYQNKILLQYKDGKTATVEYLPESKEMVYYTRDANQIAINEYYIKE